jgi:hypothetical protein
MRSKFRVGLALLASLCAQVSFGDSISGTIASSGDAHTYAILLSGGSFSATTCGTPGSLSDTQLFLFDSGGLGVLGNDDDPEVGCGLRSTIASDVLTGGLYYLGISGFNTDPVSPDGLIFPDTPYTGLHGPTGPGGGSPFSGWTTDDEESEIGDYTIDLTGASLADGPAAVPEPISLLLFGSGLAGIAGLRKKRSLGK